MRFELLKLEMIELQQHLRANHVATYQTRGWAVTVAVAAGGLGLTGQPLAAWLGLAGSVLFALLESHIRLSSSAIIQRARTIERALREDSIRDALAPDGSLRSPWLAHALRDNTVHGVRRIPAVLRTVVRPGTSAFYLLIMGLQIIAMIATSSS